MASENDDPIYDIRVAIATALREHLCIGEMAKAITDRAVDLLPDYFRQPLQAASGNQGLSETEVN